MKQDDPRAQSKNKHQFNGGIHVWHTYNAKRTHDNKYVCKNVEGMKPARTCNVCNKCQWQWKALWNALITAEKLRTLHGETWRDLGCNVNNKEQCEGIRWPGGETKWSCENGKQVATNKEVVAEKRDKTDHLQSRPLRQGVSSCCKNRQRSHRHASRKRQSRNYYAPGMCVPSPGHGWATGGSH